MSATQLPPLRFDDGGLRIVLVPQDDDQDQQPQAASSSSQPSGSSNRKSHRQSRRLQPRFSLASGPAELHGGDSQPADAQVQRASNIPTHPIPAFQHAFAESLEEVTTAGGVHKPKLRGLDARARRELLLSQGRQDDPFDVKWRYRPGQTQHEIIKLLAQISFGVYLMLNGMANSTAQVITILQGHIDEVDEFLEVALEDQDQAIEDLRKRINHLKLPMANMEVFEQLLTDRKFRNDILDGNEKIDAILDRTNVAVRQWDDDIESGLRSSAIFAKWLQDQDQGDWHAEHPELVDVFDAMKGNTDGWITAFEDMNNRAQDINDHIVTLMNIVTEMEAKAGEVSRKFPVPAAVQQYPTSAHGALQPAQPAATSLSPVPTLTSNQHSTPKTSTGGNTPSPQNPFLDTAHATMDDDDDDDSFFPLPGILPLLPPITSRQVSANQATSPARTTSDAEPVELPDSARPDMRAVAAASPALAPPSPAVELESPVVPRLPQPTEPKKSEHKEEPAAAEPKAESAETAPKQEPEPESKLESTPVATTEEAKVEEPTAESLPADEPAPPTEEVTDEQPKAVKEEDKVDPMDARNSMSSLYLLQPKAYVPPVPTPRVKAKAAAASEGDAKPKKKKKKDGKEGKKKGTKGKKKAAAAAAAEAETAATSDAAAAATPAEASPMTDTTAATATTASAVPASADEKSPVDSPITTELTAPASTPITSARPATSPAPAASPAVGLSPAPSPAPLGMGAPIRSPARSPVPVVSPASVNSPSVTQAPARAAPSTPSAAPRIVYASPINMNPNPTTTNTKIIPVVLADSDAAGYGMEKSLAMRERSSNPPDAIRIPPLPQQRRQPSGNGSLLGTASPRVASSASNHESSSQSAESQPPRIMQAQAVTASPAERPALVPSPRSEHNFYRPVQASPHSPLQQRPSTAVPPGQMSADRPAFYRNQPSQLGAMSIMSASTYDDNGMSPRGDSRASERGPKKKKSAFGWFKKAFTMDDDERAAFESRRGMQQPQNYYQQDQPRFLDGRRIR